METLEQRLYRVIASELGMDPHDVGLHDAFIETYGCDYRACKGLFNSIGREFDIDMSRASDDLHTPCQVMAYISEIQRDSAKKGISTVQEFSTKWLQQITERYRSGLIGDLEFVLQLQVSPEVVTSMLAVNKLPFMAARKIEISDLLHDDPRIEMAAEKEAPVVSAGPWIYPAAVTEFLWRVIASTARHNGLFLADEFDISKEIDLRYNNPNSSVPTLGFKFATSKWHQAFLSLMTVRRSQYMVMDAEEVIWVPQGHLHALQLAPPDRLFPDTEFTLKRKGTKADREYAKKLGQLLGPNRMLGQIKLFFPDSRSDHRLGFSFESPKIADDFHALAFPGEARKPNSITWVSLGNLFGMGVPVPRSLYRQYDNYPPIPDDDDDEET